MPKQADGLVLNLKDTNKQVLDIASMIERDPIKGLKELLTVDKRGKVYRLLPEPGPVE